MRGPGGRRLRVGESCWMHSSAADAAVARGDYRFADDRIAGPSESKVVGPSERKVVGPPESKALSSQALTIKAEGMTKAQLWADLKSTRDDHGLSWSASKDEMVREWVARGGGE